MNELPTNAIPFDWDKWKTGEYIVRCRDGSIEVSQTDYHLFEGLPYPLYWFAGNEVRTFVLDGRGYEDIQSRYDLFLIPKKKVMYYHMVSYQGYNLLTFTNPLNTKKELDALMDKGWHGWTIIKPYLEIEIP